MKKTKIAPSITYVEPDSMADFSSCSGIIIQGKQTVFIDMNIGKEDTIDTLNAYSPDLALITHYHQDHSLWTRYVKDFSDATIMVPAHEENYLTSLDFLIQQTAGALGQGQKWQNFVVNTLGHRALDGHETYDKNTRLTDRVPGLLAIATPGHSPGHTSFYLSNEKILFSGDVGLDRFGPWYGWADCNIKNIVSSLFTLMGMDIRLVLTSHGGIIRKDIQQAWETAICHIFNREKKIAKKLSAGIEKKKIIQQGVFFPGKTPVNKPMKDFIEIWDTSMYNQHERLLNQGGLSYFFPKINNLSLP
ncbi:MAG: MBL fold metallo-hydrolase [Desulfobacteraceae bacterium]|nr:MBL fold metallo-hydrolase [Desulfobacteraceae bacterium]